MVRGLESAARNGNAAAVRRRQTARAFSHLAAGAGLEAARLARAERAPERFRLIPVGYVTHRFVSLFPEGQSTMKPCVGWRFSFWLARRSLAAEGPTRDCWPPARERWTVMVDRLPAASSPISWVGGARRTPIASLVW